MNTHTKKKKKGNLEERKYQVLSLRQDGLRFDSFVPPPSSMWLSILTMFEEYSLLLEIPT